MYVQCSNVGKHIHCTFRVLSYIAHSVYFHTCQTLCCVATFMSNMCVCLYVFVCVFVCVCQDAMPYLSFGTVLAMMSSCAVHMITWQSCQNDDPPFLPSPLPCVSACVCACVCVCVCVKTCQKMLRRYWLWHSTHLALIMHHMALLLHCNTLQHIATHCKTLKHNDSQYTTAHKPVPHCNTPMCIGV